MKKVIVHHVIRREGKLGSGKTDEGIAFMRAMDLPEGHSPAKLLPSRRHGRLEGQGPVHREPREGMMVEKRPHGQRA